MSVILVVFKEAGSGRYLAKNSSPQQYLHYKDSINVDKTPYYTHQG